MEPDATELAMTPYIERYVAGESTPAETERVEAWIAEHPEAGSALLVLRQRAMQLWAEPVRVDADAARDRLWARLQLQDGATPAAPARGTGRGLHTGASIRRWWRAGIAMGAVAGMALLARSYGLHSKANPWSQHTRVVATAAGQRTTVSLGNGAVATLGPVTTLRVTPDEVIVSGEALFEVAHHSQTPVVVQAGRLVVRVLGTRFVVRRYDTDAASRVIVANGRVAVRMMGAPKQSVVLDSAALAVATDSDRIMVTRGIAIDDYTALTQGRLVFRDQAFRDVVPDINRSYDVEIRVMDSTLAQRHLTFTASVTSESLADVLDVMALALGAHYTRAGRIVTFTPGTRNPAQPRHSSFTGEPQYGR